MLDFFGNQKVSGFSFSGIRLWCVSFIDMSVDKRLRLAIGLLSFLVRNLPN